MEYSRDTPFLNLLPDSRLRQARHVSAFIKAWHDAGRPMGERDCREHQRRAVSFIRGHIARSGEEQRT
jgi:hypothetical protein